MKKIVFLNIVILLALLIALELACSLAFYIKDEKQPLALSDSAVDFPYLYYTFRPQIKDGSAFVNSDGLYTRYERKKPAGCVRVVLMGGSTARGMLSNNTISECLERSLKKEFPARKIEVVNAGMSGYVLEQLFIFYQLILSKYDPDILVGLNGYNDLISVKLNRYSGLYFAPQNMRQFEVIRQGKGMKTLLGRLENIFPGIFRMADFFRRFLSGRSLYDYSAFDAEKIKEAASTYTGTVKDIRSFCAANGVTYLEFLQPVKWYVKGNYDESIKRGGIPQLVKLYDGYEQGLSRLSYGYSLTGLFADSDKVFRDDCHVSEEGNELFTTALLNPIMKYLKK